MLVTDTRPTADALLERIKEQDRARLRIYIGAAPGVGKTYAMLREAHALRARGLDVVVGFVETYGRQDTDAQIKDPRWCHGGRSVSGATLEEMNVDAIVRRKPQVCRGRAGACERARQSADQAIRRREDLLEAGIHVLTAVNIQHLETLTMRWHAAVCARETVPDTPSIAPTKRSTWT